MIGPLIAQVSSSRDQVLSLAQQAFIGKQMAAKYPFNRKIDNFMEIEIIDNMVISSIQDEEIVGTTRPVGVLQLFNRVASDILQDDVARVHYIRKLIGAMMVKCEMHAISLELTCGMARNQDVANQLKERATSLQYGHI